MSASYYDEEQEKIREVGQDLNNKWRFVVSKLPDIPMANDTARRMVERWHSEAVQRYQEIGFIAEVDITPALAGVGTPVISIVSRTEKHAFDHDKKAWEINKSRSQGGK